MSSSFPQCVYLGEFDSDEYGNLPAYLPAEQGGFCLHYAADAPEQESFANRQVENTVLCLLEDTPANLLKVEIFDFANRPNFPFLNQLKEDGLCHISLNEQATTNRFNELESIIQKRYHSLFNSDETHLNQYNARSPRPECFYVLIINTAYFPTSSLSAQRMHNFLTTAYGAGIYIIALHNEALYRQNEYASNNQALQKLLQTLPEVRMTQQSLMVDENTLPVQKMAQFDFCFTPADVNQTQIIQGLQKQRHTADDTDTDFLSVKIGTRPVEANTQAIKQPANQTTDQGIQLDGLQAEVVTNPNKQQFQNLEELIAQAKNKLKQVNGEADETSNDIDTPDWLK